MQIPPCLSSGHVSALTLTICASRTGYRPPVLPPKAAASAPKIRPRAAAPVSTAPPLAARCPLPCLGGFLLRCGLLGLRCGLIGTHICLPRELIYLLLNGWRQLGSRDLSLLFIEKLAKPDAVPISPPAAVVSSRIVNIATVAQVANPCSHPLNVPPSRPAM